MAEDSSKVLVEMLQNGDREVAEAIFQRYVARLIALTRNRLSAKLGRRVDPEDIVQSAFRSFFRRAEAGDYEFDDPGDLWRLLTVITLNKLRRKAEYHSAAKRNFGAERHAARDEDVPRLEAVSHDPPPGIELETKEEIETLCRGFSQQHQRIVELRLQGYQQAEIAEDANCTERTVRRVMERFRNRLEERMAELEAGQ